MKFFFNKQWILKDAFSSSRLYALVLILATALSLPVMVQALDPSEIEVFKTQLSESRGIDKALTLKVDELKKNEDTLQYLNLNLQKELGDLLRQLNVQNTELVKLNEEVDKFGKEYSRCKKNIADIENSINLLKSNKYIRYPSGYYYQEAGFAMAMDLRNYDNKLNDLNKKLESSRTARYAAENLYNTTLSQKNNTVINLQKTKADKEKNESEIKNIKASLSEIRELQQTYAIELAEFEQAITNFERWDTNSDRNHIDKHLRSKSAQIGNLIINARKLL